MSKRPGKAAGGRKKSVWYGEGLRFSCQPDCARCCVRHGEYGYVYLEGDDAERLADFLGLDLEDFLERHAVLDDEEPILRMNGTQCPFLDGTVCSVYPVRPTQCRTFPFWPDNLISRARWSRLRGFCPGIDRGDVHPLRVVRENAEARRG